MAFDVLAMQDIASFLRYPKVQKALALMHKGEVIFRVRDGRVVEFEAPSAMRKGKELEE